MNMKTEKIIAEVKSDIRSYVLTMKRSKTEIARQFKRQSVFELSLFKTRARILVLDGRADVFRKFYEQSLCSFDVDSAEQRALLIEVECSRLGVEACKKAEQRILEKQRLSKIVVEAETIHVKSLKRHISALKKRRSEIEKELV